MNDFFQRHSNRDTNKPHNRNKKNVNAYIVLFIISLLVSGAIVIIFSFQALPSFRFSSGWLFLAVLFILSAFCEYVDSSIGMGYGTTLFPLLLLLGLSRQEIVPAILMSQLIAGICCSMAHHKEGNVNLRTNKNIHKALWILGIPSFAGAFVASFLGVTINAGGQSYMNLYIGIMIALIGLFLVYKQIIRKEKKNKEISTIRLFFLGLLASFNKGVSGGGYGPLMTGGQLMTGVNGKDAIVITSLCESFTCFVALVAFFLFGGTMSLPYTLALTAGSLLTVIPSAKTVKKLPGGALNWAIGLATFILGLITIGKWITT